MNKPNLLNQSSKNSIILTKWLWRSDNLTEHQSHLSSGVSVCQWCGEGWRQVRQGTHVVYIYIILWFVWDNCEIMMLINNTIIKDDQKPKHLAEVDRSSWYFILVTLYSRIRVIIKVTVIFFSEAIRLK